MLLDRDGFAKTKPIVFNNALSEILFILESRSAGKRTTKLKLSGLPEGTYEVTADDLSISTFKAENSKENVIMLPGGEKKESNIVIRRIKR